MSKNIVLYKYLSTFGNGMKIDNSLKSNFEKYSLDGLENYLDKLDNDELILLLGYLNKNVNLINQFPNKKILKFRNFLKGYCSNRNIETQYFYNIELIEDLYKNILDEKKKLKFDDELDLIQNLFQFSKEKYNVIN